MSELIAQSCAKLEEWKENGQFYQTDDSILNDIVTELERLQSSNATSFRREMNKVTKLLSENIIYLNESILTVLMNDFLQLLKQWRESENFKVSYDSETCENLCTIFTDSNYSHYSQNESFIEEFNQCLLAIARLGKVMYIHSNMKVISSLFINYTIIHSHNRGYLINDSPFEDAIFKCLFAPYTAEVVTQLKASAKSGDRSPAEQFVFDGLFDFLMLMNRDRLEQQAWIVRKHLLPSVCELVKGYASEGEHWSESAIRMLEEATLLFLYYVQMTETSDQDLDVQISLVDTAIKILPGNCRSIEFHKHCIQYVYLGTQNDKILDHLKSEKLTPTMLKLLTKYENESDIQFNIYRILAAIMTEDDIKRLADPEKIARVFLDCLRSIMHDSVWVVRLKNLLASLKTLLQHDQIRDEIYKQSGISLFIQCANSSQNDPLVQQRALENLLIMSFNKNVQNELKQNTDFLEYIKNMSETSTNVDLQRASESLFWLLTKEETSESSHSTDQSSKTTYDIMISYCHKDKDLCFQLYDRLQEDNFRVWIDRDQMHGTPLEAMSNAIENSEFVLVCMSDGYKQSGYCKMEAYYAVERQCLIIPLVVKAQYRPDGWLGIIVTGRMRVDFPKYGFEDAYQKLIVEINRTRKEKKADLKSTLTSMHHEMPSKNTPPVNEEKTKLQSTYQAKTDHRLPSNIEQWTIDDVQQFLLKQHLESLLPICSQMTGTRLLAMYKMCLVNSPLMFQSLNNELVMSNTKEKRQILTLSEYLQFLEETKSFVPASIEKSDPTNVPRSALCVLS
ncbi:unnamed protein product [Adineta ricciae]|uniref:TIR domain-containing protein n=1 Tax=Adineta ricciae TaxID=249248 RepID=A0A815DS74_ADIRI|nr:unnamed protein product [Adineta ricciae]CAF1304959.1 unnamed protein product [Adineta ricciae]